MSCTHPRRATDNVISWCEDCGEDWTAVTIPGMPEDIGCLHFGAQPETCPCGAPWLYAAGGRYCEICDAL